MEGRRTPGRGWIEGVLARRPTGVIAVFAELSESVRTQLAARGIPLVIVDPTGEPLHDTPSIGATNWNGGLTATRHLLGLGHRRIAVIGGPSGSCAAGPASMASGPRWMRPASRWRPTSISHGEFDVDEGVERDGPCCRWPTRLPRS